MSLFGWSVGDIVTAIKIIGSIIAAFDQAKGAKKQYAISCGFLRQLVPVLRRLQNQIKETQVDEVRQELIQNARTINDAYACFDDHLSKKYNGLSAREPGKTKQILATVRWSYDELHDKVQKLQGEVTGAMQPYMTLMLQSIHAEVGDMAEDFRSMSASNEESNQRLCKITSLLETIKENDVMLHAAALDYQAGLAEEERRHRAGEHAELHDTLGRMEANQRNQATKADMVALQAHAETTKLQVETMLAAHSQLIQSRDELLLTMQKQQAFALDEVEAARWERLQDRAERQAKEQAVQQKEAEKQFEDNILAAGGAVKSIGAVTGDRKIDELGEKAKGASELMILVNKFFPRSRKENEQVPVDGGSGQRTGMASSPNAREPRVRTPKPPPPIPSVPPPQRIDRQLLAVPNNGRRGSVDSRRSSSSTSRVGDVRPPQGLLPPASPGVEEQGRRSSQSSGPREPIRPQLPARPRTDSALSTAVKPAPPPLPPRPSPTLLASKSSLAVPNMHVTSGSPRRTGIESPSTASNLAGSSTTATSCASPSTPTRCEATFSMEASPSDARVKQWLASTSPGLIAQVESSSREIQIDKLDSDSLSFAERRRMFESSPIMGLGAPS